MPDGDSPAESYQIRLSTDSVKFYKPPYYSESSNPSSSTSRLTSPTQKTHPTSQSSSSGSTAVISATNPIGDYEQIDEYSRVPNPDTNDIRVLPHGSVTVAMPTMVHTRNYSERGASTVGGGLPPTLSASVMFSVREEEEKLKRSISTSTSRPAVSRTSSNGGGFNRSRSASNTSPLSGGNFTLNHSQSVSKVPLQQHSHLLESQMTSPRDSQCSECPPPPYSSRPPSSFTASASSMVGNDAYEDRELTGTENGNDSSPHPWYHTESDFSLDSNSRRDFNNKESIPPYAMIHNSAIPVTQSGLLGTSLPNNIQAMPPSQQVGVGSSAVKRPVLFSIERKRSRGTPQPYSEPIVSSTDTLASYGRAQESPNFEMVTV